MDSLRNKTECQCLCVEALQDSPGFSSLPGSDVSACVNTDLLSHGFSGFLCNIHIMVYACIPATHHKVKGASCCAHGLNLWIAREFLTPSHLNALRTTSEKSSVWVVSKCCTIRPDPDPHFLLPLIRSHADPTV